MQKNQRQHLVDIKMAGGKKLLEEIHPLRIIKEVEKRPSLYSKESTHLNKHLRNQLWTEIAKKLLPEWATLNELEKEQKILDLTKKWRNLRDTFIRELELEKKIKEGYYVKKKKVYVYYKHMTFMIPYIQNDELERPSTSTPARSTPRKQEHKPPVSRKHAKLASTDDSSSDIDEDKHFLMSLIPSFKKMTEDEKLAVKMEFLKVIKGFRNKSRLTTSNLTFQAIDSISLNEEDANTSEAFVVLKEEMLPEDPIPVEYNSLNPKSQANSEGDDDSDWSPNSKMEE